MAASGGRRSRRLRVAVTRAAGQAAQLVERIEAIGCDAVLWPLIAIEPLAGEPVDPGGYDWVVVTSRNGAAELARRLVAPPRRLAAIGPGTAATLREHGLEPALVPRVSTQEGLLAELPQAPGGCSSTSSAPTSWPSTAPSSSSRPTFPTPTSSCSPHRRLRVRSLGAEPAPCRCSRSGPRPRQPRAGSGSSSRAKPSSTTSTG